MLLLGMMPSLPKESEHCHWKSWLCPSMWLPFLLILSAIFILVLTLQLSTGDLRRVVHQNQLLSWRPFLRLLLLWLLLSFPLRREVLARPSSRCVTDFLEGLKNREGDQEGTPCVPLLLQSPWHSSLILDNIDSQPWQHNWRQRSRHCLKRKTSNLLLSKLWLKHSRLSKILMLKRPSYPRCWRLPDPHILLPEIICLPSPKS
jgi:hypothetical protein